MKHIITFSLFTFTFSFVALHATAAPSMLAINSEAYSKDSSPSAESTLYSAYFCTVEAADTMFKKSTVAGLTSYFAASMENFGDGRDLLADYVSGFDYAQTFDWDTESSQYVFTYSFGEELSTDDYLAILLYQASDTDAAVRVLSNADEWSDVIVFDDADTSADPSAIGAWTAVQQDVPEPTSGLLLLLGLSGLALKRRELSI